MSDKRSEPQDKGCWNGRDTRSQRKAHVKWVLAGSLGMRDIFCARASKTFVRTWNADNLAGQIGKRDAVWEVNNESQVAFPSDDESIG